jgi:hypothetical protein
VIKKHFMKNIFLLLCSILVSVLTTAQCNLTLSGVSTSTSCFGSCDGSITVTPTGGTAPFQYAFTGGVCGGAIQGSGVFAQLSAGNYTVSVTDQLSCTATATLTISQPANLFSYPTPQQLPSCTPGCDGTAIIVSTGGTPPYSYSTLNSIIAGNLISGLCANSSYTVTTTDANSCTQSTILTMTGLPNLLSASIASQTSPSCLPGCDGTIQLSVNGGTPPYSYFVNPPSTPISTSGFVSGLCASNIYSLTVVDANGCIDYLPVLISPNTTAPSSSIANSTYPSCTPGCDGTVTMQVNAGINFSIQPVGPIWSGLTASGLCAGTNYTITMSDMNGCTSTINHFGGPLNPQPINTFGNEMTCGSITPVNTYPAPTSLTYSIFPGGIINTSGSFTIPIAGSYTVVATNAANCSVSTVTNTLVNSNALVGVNINSTIGNESCMFSNDGHIVLNANPSNGLVYLWNNNATTSSIYNLTHGNYSVTISNTNGDCMYWYDTVQMTGINCGIVKGKIYFDSDTNCQYSAADYGLNNQMVLLSTGAIAYTNPNGDYTFSLVPYGNHALTHNALAPYNASSCAPPGNVLLNASNAYSFDNDYADSTMSTLDEQLFITTGLVNPALPTTSVMLYSTNQSPYVVQNELSLVIPDTLNFLSSTLPPTNIISTPNGDSIIWLVTLQPFSSSYQNANNLIEVTLSVPSTLVLGNIVSFAAHLVPLNYYDMFTPNNHINLNPTVSASYDPNDKQVVPVGQGSPGYITPQDSILNYTIRFQNTGTAPAYNIVVLDTISNKLDITKFKVIGYSHLYTIEVLPGNVLKFNFPNIMLPDSNSNEPDSHGFISFSIHQKGNNLPGTEIENTAAIYFDYNPPVITNTTLNTLALPTFEQTPHKDLTFSVYPNPVTEEFQLRLINKGDAQLIVYNSLGQQVFHSELKEQQIRISTSGWVKGIYTIQVNFNGTNEFQKLIVR